MSAAEMVPDAELVAELDGLRYAPDGPGGLRLLHHPGSRRWLAQAWPIYTGFADAADLRRLADMCLTVLTAGQGEDSVVVFDDGYGTADVTIGFDTVGQLGVSVCVYLDAAGTPDTPPITDNARPSAISAVELTATTYNPDRLADAANALLAALTTRR